MVQAAPLTLNEVGEKAAPAAESCSPKLTSEAPPAGRACQAWSAVTLTVVPLKAAACAAGALLN